MRLIDADALFKEFEKTAWYDNANRDEIAEEILLQTPTIDAVEVVRCKDCKHRKEKTCFHPCSGMWVGVELKDNDFCSYGERK